MESESDGYSKQTIVSQRKRLLKALLLDMIKPSNALHHQHHQSQRKVDLPPQASQPKTTKDIRNFFNSNRKVKSTTTKKATSESTNIIEIN